MKKKILIIEDEPSIAENIRYALETEGFQSLWRATASEGLAELSKEIFDLIVLDIGLPDQTGLELCREIRKKSSVPIIFLTARAGEIDRILGLELGADDYMVKPFSPRELTVRIKAILRRTQFNGTVPSPALGLPQGFFIDESKYQISFHGQILPLSKYEYLLLKVFLTRPGRVLSRDQLMELAWDNAESSLDRTVDAHIKSLRAKIKKVASNFDPIETHRGLGYSFKENT